MTKDNHKPKNWDYKNERRLAEVRKENSKLHFYQYDKNGIRLESTRAKVSLVASPSVIGMESDGLGAYFLSTRLFMVAILFYCLVSAYPFYTYVRDGNRFSKYYTLEIFDATSGATTEVECEKFWSVSSAFSRISLGTYCQPTSQYTSPVNCPAICTFNTSTWTAPGSTCQNDPVTYWLSQRSLGVSQVFTGETDTFFEALNNSSKLNDVCNRHLPCSGSFSHGANSTDGSCNCCELQVMKNDTVLADGTVIPTGEDEPRPIMWQFYGLMVLYWLWQLLLEYQQRTLSEELDRKKLTGGDFSVFVRGLPKLKKEKEIRRLKEQLTEYASHWGDVVCVSPMINLGPFMRYAKRLEELHKQRAEIEARVEQGSEGGFFAPIYYYMFGIRKNATKALKAVDKEIESVKAALGKAEKGLHLRATGSAIINFQYQLAAENFKRDHTLSPIGWLLIRIPFLGQALNHDCCRWAPVFKMEFEGCCGVKRYVLTVDRASEPSDILWENTDNFGIKKFFRDLTADIVAVIIILFGIGVQLGLEYWKKQERDKLTGKEVALSVAVESTETPIGTIPGISTTEIKAQAISVICSIIIVLMNMIIVYAVRLTVDLEAASTVTQRHQSTLWRLSAAFIVNSFVIPVGASTFTKSGREHWFATSGLSTEAISIQVSNALIPPLLTMLDPWRILMRKVFPKYARSQAQLDLLLEPEEFLLAEKLAAMVKTMALGILYTPITPISPYIAFGALVLAFLADKHMALRTARCPANIRVDAVQGVHWPLAGIQIVMVFFVGLAFFKHRTHDWRKWLWIAGITWGAMYLLPWFEGLVYVRRRFGRRVATDDENSTTFQQAMATVSEEARNEIYLYKPKLPRVGVSEGLKKLVDDLHDVQHLANANPVPLVGQKSLVTGPSGGAGMLAPGTAVAAATMHSQQVTLVAAPSVHSTMGPAAAATLPQPTGPANLTYQQTPSGSGLSGGGRHGTALQVSSPSQTPVSLGGSGPIQITFNGSGPVQMQHAHTAAPGALPAGAVIYGQHPAQNQPGPPHSFSGAPRPPIHSVNQPYSPPHQPGPGLYQTYQPPPQPPPQVPAPPFYSPVQSGPGPGYQPAGQQQYSPQYPQYGPQGLQQQANQSIPPIPGLGLGPGYGPPAQNYGNGSNGYGNQGQGALPNI